MPFEAATEDDVAECGLQHARWIRAEASAPMVVMIHGRAGTAKVISAFAATMPERCNLLAPQATIPDLQGFSWWDVSERFNFKLAQQAAELVLPFIFAACERYELAPKAFYLLGFSQGAALSATLMQLRPDLFSGLAILAGFAPKLELPRPLDLKGKKIFIAHGSEDDVIPVIHAQQSEKLFLDAGAEVLLHIDPVAHKLGTAGMRQLKAWASANFY